MSKTAAQAMLVAGIIAIIYNAKMAAACWRLAMRAWRSDALAMARPHEYENATLTYIKKFARHVTWAVMLCIAMIAIFEDITLAIALAGIFVTISMIILMITLVPFYLSSKDSELGRIMLHRIILVIVILGLMYVMGGR